MTGELGRGAGTVVYGVRRDGADWAMKIRLDSGRLTDRDVATFRREAALLALASCPWLPHVYEVGLTSGRPYLVMDLIEGQQLAQLLRDGPRRESSVLRLARDVARALAAAHLVGLIHRDVKPHNIMVQPDGTALLIDFGLAAMTAAHAADTVVGTLAYAAPEQSGTLNRVVDARSDLYSLGVVLYESATGVPPFTAPDVGGLLRMHATLPAPDIRAARPELSAGLAAIVATLLAKDPDDRYQSAAALVADLGLVMADPGAPLTVHRASSLRAPHRVAFIGRTAELTELLDAWREATAGHGSVAIVRGEQGSGKSRLLSELAGRVEDAGFPVLFAPAEDAAPLVPLRRAIDGYLGELERFEPERRTRALAQLTGAAAATAPGLLARLSPSLGAALLAAEPDAGAVFAGPSAPGSVDDAIPGLAAFLVELARRSGGLCLCIDDAEQLDGATRRVLARAARELQTTPIVIAAGVGTDRERLDDPSQRTLLPAAPVRRTVELRPLNDRAVAELIGAFASGLDFDDELVTRLAARGGRTPLEILEFLTAVIEAGVLSPAWGSWELDAVGLDSLDLPDTVRGLVTRRIDRMGGPALALLEVAAVIGRSFSGTLVARVVSLPAGQDPERLLAAAAAAGVLLQSGDAYTFTHGRTRTAILDRMPPQATRELHQRVAQELERVADHDQYAIARHYLHGIAERAPDRAIRAWEVAGEQALSARAGEEAVEFLERAVELSGSAPTASASSLAHLRILRADAYAMTGRLTDCLAALADALTCATDPLERAQLMLRTAQSQLAAWDMDEAIVSATRGLAELGGPKRKGHARLLLDAIGSIAAGTFVEVTRIGFGTARADQRLRFQTLTDLSQAGEEAAALAGRPSPLVMMSMLATYAATRLGPSRAYIHFRVSRGIFFSIAGLPGSSRSFARAERAAVTLGTPEAMALIRFGRVTGRTLSGKADERGPIEMLTEVGHLLPVSEYLNTLGGSCLALMGRGRMREARSWYERAATRLDAIDLLDHNLELVGLATAAGLGRVAEGDARRRKLDASATDFAGSGMRANYLTMTAIAAVEQHDLGARFERIAWEAGALRPRVLLAPQRILYAALAYGMLERCRTASAEQMPAALADAERAVRALGRVPADAILAAHARVCAADLELVRGHPLRAISMVGAADALLLDNDVPLATFEAARVRARACAAVNRPAEQTAHALFAVSIAEQFGWPHRATWVRMEFAESVGRTFASGSASRHSSTIFTDTNSSSTYGRRLAALEQLSLAASRIVDPDQLTRVALDQIIEILSAERAFLFLADGEESRLVPHLGRDAVGSDLTELTEYGSTLVERVRLTREPIVVTGTDEGAALGSKSAVVHGLRSIMVAPLLLDGRLIGVVYLDSRIAKGMFTTADAGTLAAITTHVAAALETARAAELSSAVRAAEQQLRVAETMRDVMSELVSTLDPREVLSRLHRAMARALPADESVLLAADGDRLARLPVPLGASEADLPDPDGALVSRLLRAAAPVVGAGPAAASLLGSDPAATLSWLAVPLRARETVVGVLVFAAGRAGAYGAGEVELAAALAGQGMVAYDNARLFAEVRHLAITDALTGVFNRGHFFTLATSLLEETTRRGSELTAAMLDIDLFKRVNDTYGHPVGDEVIRAVAARVGAITRDGDVLARYGGEEFALLLPEPRGEASRIAERIRRAVADTPIETAAGPVSVTVSVGVAHRSADDVDPGALLGRADLALYEAKQSGRNRVVTHAAAR